MGIQKASYQKLSELRVNMQNCSVNFIAANRQFDWLEISLVFYKNDKHTMICDSYIHKVESMIIQSSETKDMVDIMLEMRKNPYSIPSI